MISRTAGPSRKAPLLGEGGKKRKCAGEAR
jgi:hypothetical protein